MRGYLLKDMEPEDVIAAIGNAARGELTVAPAMTLKLAQLLQSGGKGSDRRGLLASLTERERQILEHLARGESNKTIARALDISHDTVKLHVRHILSKLNLSSRVEAAVFAVEARGGGESTYTPRRECSADERTPRPSRDAPAGPGSDQGHAPQSPGTLPTSSRNPSNGPMLPMASIFGPAKLRRPNIMAFIGP